MLEVEYAKQTVDKQSSVHTQGFGVQARQHQPNDASVAAAAPPAPATAATSTAASDGHGPSSSSGSLGY